VLATLSSRISGLIAVPPRGSKLERANAVSSLVEAGNVYLPHPEIAPWVGAFIEELADFPNGENDDQVDAASQALARMLHPKSGTIREVIAQSVSWASPEAPAAWSQGW
ncbi:MAG: phage terminase large subunit, partial [Proteobacteria bacterium]|nr:phage terminase large subunit [Pseudomonadota bacterium]